MAFDWPTRSSASASRGRTVEWVGRTAPAPTSAVVLLPTWQIIGSQFWKLQVGYPGPALPGAHLRRPRHRPLVRPVGAAAYADAECAADIIAVLDATAPTVPCWSRCPAPTPGRCTPPPNTLIGWPASSRSRPPAVSRSPTSATRPTRLRCAGSRTHQGWAMLQQVLLAAGRLPGIPAVLLRTDVFGAAFRQADRGLSGLGGGHRPGDAGRRHSGPTGAGRACCVPLEADCRRVRCPVTVCTAPTTGSGRSRIGERLAELTGGSLIAVEGGGHALPAREPVLVNRLIRDWSTQPSAAVRVRATRNRRRPAAPGSRARAPPWVPRTARAGRGGRLFLSSPDRARPCPARRRHRRELRELRPDVEIDWLAQHPVTRVLDRHRRADPPRLGGAAQRIGTHRE